MAVGTPVLHSNANVYVPTDQSTNGLVIDFSRNVDSFKLNQYCKLFPVDMEIGYYWKFGAAGGLPEEAGRILVSDEADIVWHDGAERPSGNDSGEVFALAEHRTIRYDLSWTIGDRAGKQASWDMMDKFSRIYAQQMMTRRTAAVISVATTSGNYPTGHYSAVSAITGNTGKWDVSTVARQDIRRSINTACEKIRLDTLGAVQQSDLVLVMSPGCAYKILQSAEIVDYLKSQESSYEFIQGKLGTQMYDFPAQLYGVKVVIEDAVKATNARFATRAVSNVLADTTPFIVSRPGGLVGDANSPDYSSLALFVWKDEEMKVETFYEEWHKRTLGAVVDNREAQLAAGAAAYLFTAATD